MFTCKLWQEKNCFWHHWGGEKKEIIDFTNNRYFCVNYGKLTMFACGLYPLHELHLYVKAALYIAPSFTLIFPLYFQAFYWSIWDGEWMLGCWGSSHFIKNICAWKNKIFIEQLVFVYYCRNMHLISLEDLFGSRTIGESNDLAIFGRGGEVTTWHEGLYD